MKTPWIRNGKAVTIDGKPTLCDECPCGEKTCQEKVRGIVNALLAEKDPETEQPIWTLIGFYEATFSCAQWTYGEGGWTLATPSSGSLLIAVPHTDTQTLYYTEPIPFHYASVVYNLQTGYYRTIGCRCRPSTTTYKCEEVLSSYDDYDIAGAVPVYVPEDGSDSDSEPDWGTYTIGDVCRVDHCEALKVWLEAYYRWHGGILHGEGYTDWWTETPPSEGMLEYYYAYERHLMALEINDEWSTCYTIDCDCGTFHTQHLTDRHIHDFAGICEYNDRCSLDLMMNLLWYESMVVEGTTAPLWEEVGIYNGGYQCPVWEYDGQTGNYVKTQPASGSLVMAYDTQLPEYYYPEQSVTGCGTAFISAGVIRNTQTGEYRTLGCVCQIDWYNCSPQFRVLSNTRVGGMLPVSEDSDCSPDTCADVDLYLTSIASWTGATLHGEGFVENTQNGYTYTKHQKGLQWGGDVSDSDSDSGNNGYFMYMPCGSCSCWLPLVQLDSNHSIVDATGICSQDCPDYFALRASASKHGWEFRNEGFVIHLDYREEWNPQTQEQVYYYGDWYVNGNTTGIACALAGDKMYVVSCSCDSQHEAGYWIETIDCTRTGMYGEPAPAGFWDWQEYEGACTCIDMRELMLDDPSKWGVLEISYGSNSKYSYSKTTSYEDNVYNEDTGEWEWGVITNTETGCSYCCITGSANDFFLDFRTFCWIGKYLDTDGSQKVCVKWLSPSGSPAGDWDSEYGQVRVYDSATFLGVMQPFAEDPDTHFKWTGMIYQWRSQSEAFDMYFATEQEAEQACSNASPSQPTVCGITGYDGPAFAPCVTPPDKTLTLHAGYVHYETWSPDYPWVCTPPYYSMGQSIGQYTTVVYRVQWIQTNLGILRSGETTYLPSFLLYGLHGSQGDQNWDNCYGHSGVPFEDETITAFLIDTDMHSCPDHDPDWHGSESDDSSSV